MYKIASTLLILILPLSVSSQQTDPTRPFGATAAVSQGSDSKSALVLQSIIQSNQSKKAMINGEVLTVGDKYRDFELIAINSNGVVLQSSQGRMELSLFSGVIANSK